MTPDGTENSVGSPALPFLVVGFGSSAGGLQPFRDILSALPSDTGMAFVLIPHLSAEHKSQMAEILRRSTAMPVHEIADGVRPQPNNLYVLTPGFDANIAEGRFHLQPRSTQARSHLPIDLFFRTLASDQKHFAIGVVLSGGDSDGALGLRTIKGEGGIALVQLPASAQHSSMPRNSIAADHVDLVIPPAEIARELIRLANEFKRPIVRGDELRTLNEEALISVTRFFRDTEFWDSLRNAVLPTLFESRSADRPVRVWCAGCSTGEEVYSLAITLLEYLSANNLDTHLQIFGTDASERSIDSARTAIYPDSIAAEVSPERIRRFFVKVDRGYQISKRVRDVCIFARQNLCHDPPFSHIDLLSCRNVMIYFKQVLQRRIISTFHYSLENRGYLLLGMSESLREYGDAFGVVDRKNKIYMKLGTGTSESFEAPEYQLPTRVTPVRPEKHVPFRSWPDLDLQRAADRIVLARFSPPGVIIDEHLKILQIRGQTAPFLELPPGALSLSLPRMLRNEVAEQINPSLQRAIHENIPVSLAPVISHDDGFERQLQVDILPISSIATLSRCFLVLFQTAPLPASLAPALPASSLPAAEQDGNALSFQLRLDLEATRLHLSLSSRNATSTTRSSSPPTKKSSRRTKSSKAPTKSLKPPRKRSKAPTKSSKPSTKSSSNATRLSSRPATTSAISSPASTSRYSC